MARKRFYGGGYQDVSQLPEDVVRAWLEPVLGTAQSARQFQRWAPRCTLATCSPSSPRWPGCRCRRSSCGAPGTCSSSRKWAYWLRDTIPGATQVIELDGARLFFPDERATEFTAALRRHWTGADGELPGTGVQ